MLFNYEYEKRLRLGYIGAGEQSFRNILPCLQYLPVDLVALADYDADRGLAVARQFGARHFYPNHKALLAKEELDAVIIVAGQAVHGQPPGTEMASEAIRAGLHVWIDSPPCSGANEIQIFTDACLKSRKYVMTGWKKMFSPAYVKLDQIVKSAAFGKPSSYYLRYPLALPPDSARNDAAALVPFLEFLHPYSIPVSLFGECEGFTLMRSDVNGDVVMNLRYRRGLVGTIHLTGGQARTSPLERLEVIGEGANVIVENATRLTYYRAGGTRGEGDPARLESFAGPDDNAPIVWEPEFSLGMLYNKQLFLEGYVGCLHYFVQSLLDNEPPKKANLVDMLHIMSLYSKILKAKPHEWNTPY